jgi:hypothetical protein
VARIPYTMGLSSQSPFPGFTQVSDQIYLLNNVDTNDNPESAEEPTTVIIFGWGDGKPKNVAKYVDGYRGLYPHAKMVVVLATTFKAAYQPLLERTQGMMPVVEAVFPPNVAKHDGRILIHAMSNAGGINLASTFNAYRERYGSVFPHQLVVFDSTPGGVVFREQVGRWARAMAIGMAHQLRVPYLLSFSIWYIFLWLNKARETIQGLEHAGVFSRAAMNDKSFVAPTSSRLYLYSKADDIIGWQDIEKHTAEARNLGYKSDLKLFDGTPHVGHLMRYPGEYWRAIKSSWTTTCS